MRASGVRVIFTDLPAGSCTMAARRVLRELRRRRARHRRQPADAARLRALAATTATRGAAARTAAERGRAGDRRVHGGARVTLELYRIDDRLIHGQVVVGWGQPLRRRVHRARRRRGRGERLGAGALSHGRAAGDGRRLSTRRDDAAARCSTAIAADPRPGILLTGDIATMRALVERRRGVRDGERRRHSSSRRAACSACATSSSRRTRSARCARSRRRASAVTAQDVPGARAVPARRAARRRGEGAMSDRRCCRSRCSAACSGSTSSAFRRR